MIPGSNILCTEDLQTGSEARPVGAFPDGHSALMPVAARLRHIAKYQMGKCRYLAMETLLNPVPEEAAAQVQIRLPPTKCEHNHSISISLSSANRRKQVKL